MPYIYKITNKINDKVYIGKTLNSIQKRWREHLIDSKKRKCEKRPLYSAINKYGEENFEIEQIEECSHDILNERECHWIEYYGSFKNGYNTTIGGDGKPYLDYDLIYNTYLKTKNMKQTSILCNCSVDSVRKILEIYGITKEERIKNQQNSNKVSGHPVAKIDKYTNEIIAVYESVSAAGKENPKANRQHISKVCKGKRKTAGGYKWQYL